MSTPCNNYVIPTFESDPCNGVHTDANCVLDSSEYSELSLPANSSQQEINQAQYLAAINIQAQTENLDTRVTVLEEAVPIATNTTTVALSSATLSAAYPTAITGFKVHALDIIAGGRIYEKTSTGWCEYLATITA